MESRLDRLFTLLDMGSSPLTRKAAAQQLGEVQRLHPHELPLLLRKVFTFLKSSSWETRIAAAQAVEAIVSNVPQWDPAPEIIKSEDPTDAKLNVGRLKFEHFDIGKVLANRHFLMASEGMEFEDDDNVHSDPKERLAAQRQALNQKLGIELSSKLGIDMGDFVSVDDLEVVKPKTELNLEIPVSADAVEALKQLSSREANRAKRKARQGAKQKSRELSQDKVSHVPSSKKAKKEEEDIIVADSVPDPAGTWPDTAQLWPFESFCDLLIADLFNPSWEIRHGAATALREVIRLHGRGAGKAAWQNYEEMVASHSSWLEDMALRLLCVLALDRFGDFISDQVVAPVRETCAQAIGSVAKLMDVNGVKSVVEVLLLLLKQNEWEARHGGLLGLKYLMAVRQDLSQELLPSVYHCLFSGLKDEVDDVSAVAAAALVPLADAVVKLLVMDELRELLKTLWNSLLELDELTGSTSSILTLLSSLVAHPISVQHLDSLPLVELVPRLWPFLSHSSSQVRRSTLRTLETLIVSTNSEEWSILIATDALRHVFQRAVLEHCEDILKQIEHLWITLTGRLSLTVLLPAACPFVATWICLVMQPSRIPFDPSVLIFPEPRKESPDSSCRRRSSTNVVETPVETKYYIGGTDHVYENATSREKGVIRARCLGASLLGHLSRYLVQPMPEIVYTPTMETPIECYAKLLSVHLNSRSAIQRTVVALVMAEWGERDSSVPPPFLLERLHQCLNECIYYDEIGLAYTRLLHETKDFISTMKHYKLDVEAAYSAASSNFLTPEQIQQISGPITLQLFASVKLKPKIAETLEERRRGLANNCIQVSCDQNALNATTQSALARAAVAFRALTDKLNPVIKPLMDSIKTEKNEQMQQLAAVTLARLLELCRDRTPCPNNKILKNICTFLCADVEFTPTVVLEDLDGILTLIQQQRIAEKASSKRSAAENDSNRVFEIQRKGAAMALKAMASQFGADLPSKLPFIWEVLFKNLSLIDINNPQFKPDAEECSKGQELVQNLQVIEVMCPKMHESLHGHLMNILEVLCCLLQHPCRAVRHMSSRCLASLASVNNNQVLTVLIEKVLPMLGATDSERMRQGAIEAVYCVVEQMGLEIVPYMVFLVIPVLGRMSDTNEPIRLMATQCFATLIRLMPLEGGVADPPSLSPHLAEKKVQQRLFLEQLFDSKKLDNFKVPVPVNAELRSYQQDGVNWLAFLRKYGLHGILCDDMGLGKTLQTICVLAADHYERDVEYKTTKNPGAVPLPSLVVCPPTLTGHWVYEVEKFVSSQYLNPLHYTGPPSERARLRKKVAFHNLIIASYDIVRNDLEFFSSLRWNYCVLDEGHVIKNGKTKSSKAIKQLIANHRLILSGTPIQNNVLELWSLFDFLMPGFLGNEKQFQVRYSKPILASRDAKASSKEQENGALAMEALHRQTLPFLLRRMKEDVLKDLPPKITQDYYCELSPLQVQLYEDFAKKHTDLNQSATPTAHAHIFQALQYLRKVCNHPKLVLTSQHPQYDGIIQQLKNQKTQLSDIQHASKLLALKQLLLDCGIGVDSSSGTIDQASNVVSIHRALIFCQLRSMLDIIENDLLKVHMTSVSYLRLDGSIAAGARHGVVKRFNEDPSIDVLLLTTQVGGLGLNLTGADTVIFVEHDWNPMKDIQAMDRAHRIGQKKVVNVYRLITRGTLEEKIMGYQKFKLQTANTVISTENASLQSMGTEQLLDLFALDSEKSSKNKRSSDSGEAKGGLPPVLVAALDSLPDLWSDEQYESEYNLDSFVANLNKV